MVELLGSRGIPILNPDKLTDGQDDVGQLMKAELLDVRWGAECTASNPLHILSTSC